MRVRLERASRWSLPWGGIAIFAVWGVLVGVAYLASRRGEGAPPLCNLRRFTGVQCPTCGGTRAAFALARLEPLAALAFNPLVTVLLVAVPVYFAARVVAGRRVRIEWTPRGRAVAWVVFAVVLGANWAWVLSRS